MVTTAVYTPKFYALAGENIDANTQIVSNIPILGNPSGQTSYSSNGTSVADFIKGETGNLLSIYATNESAAVKYLWVFDSAFASTNAKVIAVFTLPATGAISLPSTMLGSNGLYFYDGIYYAISSSNTTYSAAGVTASEHDIFAIYL